MDILIWGDKMIFVTLGTQDKKFTRLLVELDRLIENKIINEEIIVQAGYTSDYQSNNMKIFDLINKDEFDKIIKDTDLLITHGGVGAILTGLKYGKKIIAIPRLKKYKEHVNDHQIQIVENFNAEGYIIGSDIDNLEENILKINDFKPKKYQSNKKKMVSLVKELIDK